MSNTPGSSSDPRSDDMSEYLQMFLDETEEQLDDLVETLLVLEGQPQRVDELNEAFRLIHSIKGAAGMMGFDNIAVLTHRLENHFEAFRSGARTLDRTTMDLVLRCIDFLRELATRLRAGQALGHAAQLLEELTALDDAPPAASAVPQRSAGVEPAEQRQQDALAASPLATPALQPSEAGRPHHMTIRFESGLQLADLKARLILARLSDIAEIHAVRPPLEALEDVPDVTQFEVTLSSDRTLQEIHQTADVDGVCAIEFHDPQAQQPGAAALEPVTATVAAPPEQTHTPPPDEPGDELRHDPAPGPAEATSTTPPHYEREAVAACLALPADHGGAQDTPTPGGPPAAEPVADAAPTPDSDKARPRVIETMRVDIERLDNLMNLAGELVVNRARFVQVAGQVSPALRKRQVTSRARDFIETLRSTIEHLQRGIATHGERNAHIEELESGLAVIEEQAELWDEGRRHFAQMSEAIDQLTRISDSLQRGVLDTRMVPVAPLFNRFKRVVRDLSLERGKRVHLEIRGEKTELDKRMIDELGDPLVHLVRNSIDHGLEPPELRLSRGKSEVGTIVLEASHRGNNIIIQVRDDGGGIDVTQIKRRLRDKNILPPAAIDELPDGTALEYIWHAGFSTAREVTDVSGRGVGMDVVKTRISELNGMIEIDSVPQQGTCFTIRLPLTLAIINSLLVRVREVIFSMPIDDVREIVSVHASDIVTVRGKQTFDVRGEFVPLVGIDDIFEWNHAPRQAVPSGAAAGAPDEAAVYVVILHAADKTVGLRVDELLGSQDTVIKSLTENFMYIRGLSGASILGDGTVCLMLDVGTVLDMAVNPARQPPLRQGAPT